MHWRLKQLRNSVTVVSVLIDERNENAVQRSVLQTQKIPYQLTLDKEEQAANVRRYGQKET